MKPEKPGWLRRTIDRLLDPNGLLEQAEKQADAQDEALTQAYRDLSDKLENTQCLTRTKKGL